MVEIQNTIKSPKTFPEIWRPIASAPRDGTFVLTKSGSWQPCITHFATYDGHTRWGSSPEGFMTEEEFLRYWHEVRYDPTDWMPLPDDDVADAIETAYRNGFEDGERHAGDGAALAQSYADTYKAQLDTLIAQIKAQKSPPASDVEVAQVIAKLRQMTTNTGRDHRSGEEFVHGADSQDMVDTMRAALALLQTAPSQGLRGDLGITKEWFERRAKAEADLEIGAGFSVVNPTDADIAQMEVLAERALPQWAQDELIRLRNRSSLLDGLLSAKDMWTDYGSGYRIHFSFAVNSDTSLVGKLNGIRAALAASEGSADV